MNFSSRLEKIQYSLRVSKAILLVSLVSGVVAAQKPKPVKPALPVAYIGNKLVYTPDSLGNRIPDFSYCGYKASATSIPFVPVQVVVPNVVGDATQKIQAAINQVANLPLDANGFRGAVLLQKGIYQVWGQLKIEASGIVIRGFGAGDNGTKIIGAGTDRQTLIRITGKNDRQDSPEIKITNAYVPVNAAECNVEDATSLKVGSNVMIRRPATANWIAELGTEHFGGGITALGWKAGEQDLYFESVIAKEMGDEKPTQVLVAMDQESLVAYGGLTNISWIDKRAEMSILVSEFNNHGLRYEQLFQKFVPSLLSLAKNTFGLHRVYAETYVHRSQQLALLESAGFRYEGTLKEHTYLDGSYIDSVLHGIILQ